MSYLPLDQMKFADGPSLDAFQRLRVSNSETVFGTSQEYTSHPLLWEHYSVSGGSVTHAILTNSSTLTTGDSTSGARALRQTKLYLRYVPGKSHLIKMTGTLQKGTAPAGTAWAGIGYYDDQNGVYFRQDSGGASVVIRTNTTGSVAQTKVYSANWNLDKLDGTGASGITVDWTKEQIFICDLQWLGVGRVRFGLDIDGLLIYVHEFDNANAKTVVYMRTANLPLRYEVFNEGGAGSNISVESVCSALESEGGTDEDDYYAFCYNAYLTPVSLDTTLRPYVTRRLRDTFNGQTVRGHAHLEGFGMLIGTNPIYWEIRYNPTVTIGGGGTTVGPTNVDTTYSISEYDTYTGAANTVTGGIIIMNGFASPGSGSNRSSMSVSSTGARPLLSRTYAGVRDSYTLCARSITGAATMSVSIQLQEQY